MKDDLEQAYHNAAGCCLEAMVAMRRFAGTEAIDELNRAIRFIEHGRRKAEEKRRQELRAPRAYVEPPPAPVQGTDF